MNLEKNGAAQAALLSAMLGCLTLALINLATEMSDPFKEFVHQAGKLWMPGAEGIGPYSGKETFALVAWLGSWLILSLILRKKELNSVWVFMIFLVGLGIATTLVWPPVFALIAHH